MHHAGGDGRYPDKLRQAQQVVAMMETVTNLGGTGTLAQVPSYRVAGKTGTVHKTSQAGGYEDEAYTAIFAGMAPASRPRLVCVVVVDQPQGEQYYGGEVAAPPRDGASPCGAQVRGRTSRELRVALGR